MRTCDAEYEPKRFEEMLLFDVAEVVASHPLRADPITISGDRLAIFPKRPTSGGPPYFLQKSTLTDWPRYSGHVAKRPREKGKPRGR